MLWLIEALKRRYAVTLVTTNRISLTSLNSFYGTSLRAGDFKLKLVPMPFGLRKNLKATALRGAFYARYCRKIGPKYDLCISSYNFTDWGRPAIHFIGDLTFDQQLRQKVAPDNLVASKYIHRDNFTRKLYLGLSRIIAGKKASGFAPGNLVVANSQWVADLIEGKYDYKCPVVFPPVGTHFAKNDFADRQDAFVSLGRIAPEKRLEEQIEILEQVRDRGHNLKLYIIGHVDEHDPYGKMLLRLARDREWIKPMGRQSGRVKADLLMENRYAVHTCKCEAFGITVAEFVKAGMIPFVPKDTGPAEIVYNDRHLCFTNTQDAVDKICAMLHDRKAQAEALARLQEYARDFSVEDFQAKVRKLVAGYRDGAAV